MKITGSIKCPACDGTGKTTAADSPTGNTFPAADRKHVRKPVREIECPVCKGTGKVR